MISILSDINKFECFGPVTKCDKTAQNKTKLQNCLFQLVKSSPLAHNEQECTDFQKFTNRMSLPSYSFDDWIFPT